MSSRLALGTRVAVACVASVFFMTSCQFGSRAAVTHAGQTYVMPATQAETLDLAKQILIGHCMRRHGFRFWVVPKRVEKTQRDFPYVIEDIDWAKLHGYGKDIQKKLENAEKRDPNQRYFSSLSAPPQGCRPEIHERSRPCGDVGTSSKRNPGQPQQGGLRHGIRRETVRGRLRLVPGFPNH
ncbi:hypothetical protein [Streptomyces sp. NPDC093269]|uniref:hypothetical protein n=1 Tax=Streptomyces sp. NPDC093269 TaxID=3366038 RepID=UPI0037F32AC7